MAAFAAPISVATDKDSYNSGELVSVSGVATADAYVTVQLINPDGMRKAISQTQADETGTFIAVNIYRFTTADVSGTWTVTAYDSATEETAEYSFHVSAAPDTTPPTLTIMIAPAKASYGIETITITVSANEALSECTIQVTQEGASTVTVPSSASDGGTKWGGTYTIRSGYDGSAKIEVMAKDMSGNSADATTTFAVSTGAALEKKVASLESEVASLESKVSGFETALSSVQSKVASLEGDIASLEGDIASLEGDIASLDSSLRSDIASLKSDIASLKSDVADLEARPTPTPVNVWLVYGALIIGIIAIALAGFSLARKK
jgi:polyhydroxyalkanoate synthesis regulator phasin